MFEKVKEILQEYVEEQGVSITKESELVAELGLGSLDLVNVVVAFEEEFDVEVPDRDIWKFRTVGNIVDWLEAHV